MLTRNTIEKELNSCLKLWELFIKEKDQKNIVYVDAKARIETLMWVLEKNNQSISITNKE